MARAPIDPPTKTCANCGKTFHRKRTKNGRIQTASNWRAQTACSISCARQLQVKHHPTTPAHKTCEACGRTYERARYPNGRLENSRAWAARRACSVKCYGRLRSRENAEARQGTGVCINCGKPTTLDARNRPRKTCSAECQVAHRTRAVAQAQAARTVEHPPCSACGGPVPKPDHLSISKWLALKTCGPTCTQARKNTGGKGGHKAYRSTRVRPERPQRERLAPEGYAFNGKFPTPARVKSTWVSITGPDAPPIKTPERPARAMRGAKTAAALREATEAHPDLRAALLGLLTDSWVAMR